MTTGQFVRSLFYFPVFTVFTKSSPCPKGGPARVVLIEEILGQMLTRQGMLSVLQKKMAPPGSGAKSERKYDTPNDNAH